MPLSIMKRVGGISKCANMKLTLADKSYIVPHGIMEYILVTVGTFIYPVDFVIVDIE